MNPIDCKLDYNYIPFYSNRMEYNYILFYIQHDLGVATILLGVPLTFSGWQKKASNPTTHVNGIDVSAPKSHQEIHQ